MAVGTHRANHFVQPSNSNFYFVLETALRDNVGKVVLRVQQKLALGELKPDCDDF